MLIEFDLSGAEWVIVAHLSGDQNMLAVVASGRSPHVCTGALMTGLPEDVVAREAELLGHATDPDELLRRREALIPEVLQAQFLPRSMTVRQMGKKSNHGLNYNLKYKNFAIVNELPELEAQRIVTLYNNVAYPGLPTWRRREEREFRENRYCMTNLLGRKVKLIGQIDAAMLDKVYAYKPQSTVADIVRKAVQLFWEDPSPLTQPAELLAIVHDSVLFNYPDHPRQRLLEFAKLMRHYMAVELEADGRRFTLGVDAKVGSDWGHMEKLSVDG